MNNINKFLFITTASLSTNPRLVKELSLLNNNKNIKVIAFNIGGWTLDADKKIIQTFRSAQFNIISATRRPFIQWLFSTIVQQVAIILAKFFKRSLIIYSLAHSKRTALILLEILLNNKKYKSDLIICHTLGALYPGYILSKKTGAKLAFDMEDYHPGELVQEDSENEKMRREEILKRILPKCEYVSLATDGLYDLTVKYLTKEIENPIIVYNSFPLAEFIEPKPIAENKIKFIWFSQTIGRGRGLELFFEAIQNTESKYEITLIGNFIDKDFEQELKIKKNIIFIEPLPQNELHKKLSEYDIGLSLELNKTDLNRKNALTNKLFAYLQAGLFVVATDTSAQKDFMNKNPSFGILCGQTPEDILIVINYIKDSIQDIRSKKNKRFYEAKKFAWENESKKLTSVWEKILS